jgi:integrase
MGLEEAAKRLQYDLGVIDLLTRSSRSGREGYVELMVVRLAPLKIKIYPEDGPHKEPHVHIDYGKRPHQASYAIRTGRLAFEHLRARAQMDDFHFHDLRHEGISRLFELGLNIAEVSTIN